MRAILLWGMCSLIIPATSVQAETELLPIAVVVNKDTQTPALDKSDLSLIYLKKKLFWSTGLAIQALNLPIDNSLRKQFSHQVTGTYPEEQLNYWNLQYFHGVRPPHVAESEEGMIRYVEQTLGAIGYLHPCNMDTRVRLLLWIYPNGDITAKKPYVDCQQVKLNSAKQY